MNFFRLCIALALLTVTFGMTHAAQAQNNQVFVEPIEDTLPIEVKMLYHKLSGQQPDFMSLVQDNPSLMRKQSEFGGQAILLQNKAIIEAMYEKASLNTLIYARRNMHVNAIDLKSRVFTLNKIMPDDPILFDVARDDVFGVFIRNSNDLTTLGEPFVAADIGAMAGLFSSNRKDLRGEFILKPIAVDPSPFIIESGQAVNVILADVVEMRLYSGDGMTILAQKRFKDWRGDTLVPENPQETVLPPTMPRPSADITPPAPATAR